MKIVLSAALLFAGTQALALSVDYEAPCETELVKTNISFKKIPEVCKAASESWPGMNTCVWVLTEHTKILNSQGEANEVCHYLNGYHQVRNKTRTACIETLMNFRSAEGHPAVSAGRFSFLNYLGQAESFDMTEQQVATMTCVQNNDAVISCALGKMGIFDRGDNASDDQSGWRNRHVIDQMWEHSSVNNEATKALNLAVGLCRR